MSKRLIKTLCFIGLFNFSFAVFGQTFEEFFQSGIEFYNKENYSEASTAFTKALELNPNNPAVITNLALSEFKQGNKFYSIALLRKAHYLDPDFSTPKAGLDFITPQLEIKDIPHEIEYWETFRKKILVPVHISAFVILGAILFFASGWLLIRYFAQKRKSLAEEKPFPPFPVIGAALGVLFIAFLSLSILKIYDQFIDRATVIQEKVSVLAAPDEKAVALFELYGGLEVVVKDKKDNWVQITYPGALSGWVKSDAVYVTTEN
jgi:tetratricopeptide (TPR) repeat protein